MTHKAQTVWSETLGHLKYQADMTTVEQAKLASNEFELMRMLFMYQGILPEHLPGYARQIREATAESCWHQRLVGCFLELLALLGRLDESKKVNAMARRLVDIAFHELFRVAAGHDPKLQFHVENPPALGKKESQRYVPLETHNSLPTLKGMPFADL